MNSNATTVADKVQRYLLDMGLRGVELLPDGGWTFRMQSARIFVRIIEHQIRNEETSTIVSLFAPIVIDAKASDELWKFVATSSDNWLFSHLTASEDEDGVTLGLAHRLLGDFLDPAELQIATGALAWTAQEIDDDLVARFGGRVFHED